MDNSYPLHSGTGSNSTHGSNDRTAVITSPISYSTPLSPSALDTPDRQTRRRNSWGRVPEGQDPLRITVPPPPASFDAAAAQAEDLQTSASSPTSEDALTDGYLDEDPFANHHSVQQYHNPLHNPSAETGLSNAMMAGPSSVSLLPHTHTHAHHAHMGSMSSGLSFGLDGDAATAAGIEDDEAHLTKNMAGLSRYSSNGTWHGDDRDAEMLSQAATNATAGSAPKNGKSRRRTTTIRISNSSAAALTKRTGTRLKTMSRSLRRMSLRVVNLAGAGLEDRIRLEDDDGMDAHNALVDGVPLDDKDGDDGDDDDDDDGDGEKDTASFYDTRKSLPIRGRTLGLFGPRSAFRMSLFRFLVHP
jgi:voltage-dependent calcium channel